MEHIYDMIIIGGGPGGYTAALYAARAGLDSVVLEALVPGGQMAQAHQIDNYPGFEEGVAGYALADKMRQEAERFGARTVLTQVTEVDLVADPKVVKTDGGTYYAKTVALATGASPRQLGVPGERELTGRGVHYCADCDGMFYKEKTVVVVGGGNTAAQDAALLSRVARKVILVHRRDTLRATQIYHRPLMEADNVEFRWNSVVEGFVQAESGALTGVRLRDVNTGAQSVADCDGVFVSIGRKPASGLVQGQVELDEGGYVVAGEDTRTSLPGVYAVGDVRTKQVRQVVTAVSDGAAAVHAAEEYLGQGGG